MYKFLTKNGQFAAFGLGALVIVVMFASIFSGLGDFNMLQKEERFTTGIFNFGIYISVAMIVIAAIIMVVFILTSLVSNLAGGGYKSLIGFIIALLVFVVCFAMATPLSEGPLSEYVQKFDVSDGVSKFISASVNTGVWLTLLALISFVVAELINLFK